MALPRAPPIVIPVSGLAVGSPDAHHGTHTFRSATNFNDIVTGIINLVLDHAGDIGEIRYIKEWWEDPAIIGESDQFPCLYILPLYPEVTRLSKEMPFKSSPYIGGPLAMSTFLITLMGYYKYYDVRQPTRDVRNAAWNMWDLLSAHKTDYSLPGGLQSMTPDVGWFVSGTNYVIQWWSMRVIFSAIL